MPRTISRFVIGMTLVCLASSAWAGGLTTQAGTKVLLRGMGWSPWHASEHWNLSEATQKLDLEFLRGMNVNGLRSWGQVSPDAFRTWGARGFSFVPTVPRPPKASRFADGKPGNIVYVSPENIQRFRGLCAETAKQALDQPGCPAVLLGNEYSCVGQDKSGNWVYTGFDDETQAAFRAWLQQRFGTIAALNAACGTAFAGFDSAIPPGSGTFRYQWWLFLRDSFETYMKAGYDAAKAVAPHLNVSYAKLMGTHWDPATEDARLGFLDVQGDNLYWNWHANDWAWYNAYLNDMAANAPGKPVLISESGFLSIVLGPGRAARLTKQMLMNLFMHAPVAGACIYCYSDEWYVDGDEAHQAPGESWGIVTADRKKKPSTDAVAGVYRDIAALQPYLLEAREEPLVWVSSQDLDGIAGGADITRHVEVERALYNEGVTFAALRTDDLAHVDTLRPRKLILCDTMLPDGLSASANPVGKVDTLAALMRYLRAGGEVLLLNEKPLRTLAGELPPAATFAQSGPVGKGRLTVIQVGARRPGELHHLVRDFMRADLAAQPVSVSGGTDLFWRLVKSRGDTLLWLVNGGESPVQAKIQSRRGSWQLLASDGKPGEESTGQIAVDTYAVLKLAK